MVTSNAKRRRNLAKAQRKAEVKRSMKKESQFVKTLPKISENDLLAFQFAHFGDDSKPEKWFVTPESAIDFEPEYEDVLGYYEDGVKRTLTDEQIAVFRRTELWNMEREQMHAAEDGIQDEDEATEVASGGRLDGSGLTNRGQSPVSDASSLEDELISQAVRDRMQRPSPMPQSQEPSKPQLQPPLQKKAQLEPQRKISRQPSQGSRSDSAMSTDSNKRRRSQEVPYDERRKRQWESYIEKNDPVEGSLTHRRVARELDNHKEETFEMDY